MKKVGVLGCGWLGERISHYLIDNDFSMIVSNSTSSKKNILNKKGITSTVIPFSKTELIDFSIQFKEEKKLFETCDVVIISIPTPKTESAPSILFENIIRFLTNDKNQQLFFFNSTRIYPFNNTLMDEYFDGKLLQNSIFHQTEKQLRKAFPSINILRLSGLFGDERIFMRYFSNKILKNGQLRVNQIHYEDICAIIFQMIVENREHKIYNLATPLHPTKEEIILSQQNHYTLEKPLAIHYEDTPYKIISSEKMIQELAYTFIHPDPTLF